MSTNAQTLVIAACKLAIAQGLVPTATLTAADAVIGATTISSSDVRPFMEQTIWSVWDGTSEPTNAVDHVTPQGHSQDPSPVPGTITLAAPLVANHSPGATIATNLLPSIAIDIGPMLGNGWPVVGFFVKRRKDLRKEADTWWPYVTLRMTYQLPYERPAYSPLAPQLWHGSVLQRADADVDAFRAAVKGNEPWIDGGVVVADVITQFDSEITVSDLAVRDAVQPVWMQVLEIDLVGPIPN